MKLIDVEKREYEILQKLNFIFRNELNNFDKAFSNSMEYIYYITLPIIMASIENKSFNPFSEIIEKHISFLVNKKMEELGYKIIPLGYSSDLTFSDDKNVIHIDIKTANLNNPADFNEEIALGFNQTSYPGLLPAGIRGKEYYSNGIKDVKTYPNLPHEYLINGKQKLTITNGLLFIYPDYKEIIDEIRKEYIQIRKVIDGELLSLFKNIFKNEDNIKLFLNYKPTKTKYKRKDLIIDNLLRAFLIHKNTKITLNKKTKSKISKFSEHVINISKKLSKKEIKPVAIISISIPNGKLAPHYDKEIVSGKSFGASIRYHYNDGYFKLLPKNKSRVIFIYLNEDYLDILKNYFSNIIIYETTEKKL